MKRILRMIFGLGVLLACSGCAGYYAGYGVYEDYPDTHGYPYGPYYYEYSYPYSYPYGPYLFERDRDDRERHEMRERQERHEEREEHERRR